MQTPDTVVSIMGRIAELAPGGCALALHFKFTAPAFLLQTYSAEWTAYYTQNSLVMRDPVVAWGLGYTGHTGHRAWSSFAGEDPAGVMAAAADHGLNFGLVIATKDQGSRSVCGFARADREFSDIEAQELTGLVGELHALTLDESNLSDGDAVALRRLSVGTTQPY